MILTLFYLILFVHISTQDYIRSDELILNENLEIGSEIINLNKLMNQEKFVNTDSNLLFKIVNDTPLVNYIHLEYLNSDTTLIILKKRLIFEDICDLSMQQIEARTISSSIVTCSQTLKIIAVNENDFIEVPIEIRKINFIKKRPVGLQFKSSVINLNLTSVENWFLIDPPVIVADPTDQLVLKDKIIYSLIFDSDILTIKIQNVSDMMNLSVVFTDEKSLVKSYDFNVEFKVQLNAYFDSNLTDSYDLKSNSSQTIGLKVTELKKLNLKPLEFEQTIYSMVIENNYLNINDLIIQPKLKSNEKDIIFSLFQNEALIGEFPFYVEERTGAVRVKSQLWNEDEDYLNKNMNKNFLFGIKATYKRLIENKKASKTNYYYDYMIPAFTKIQINLRREKIDSAQVHNQILSPYISKYEILNKESSNQTFIYYVNEPIKSNSKLVLFTAEFLKSINLNHTTLEWMFTDLVNFEYEYNSTGISIGTKFEFRDGQVYKTSLKFVEKARNLKRFRVLNELNIEFRIDFDPLLFEKNEYKVSLYASNLIEEKILKIKVKDRLKKKLDQTNVENVVYRLMDSEDSIYFELDSTTGLLATKQVLTKKSYNLEFLAIDSDIQKTATVKCKIDVVCSKNDLKSTTKSIFNLFENSPNGSQIGTFKSVCSNINYSYGFESGLGVRLCSKIDAQNCKNFDLNNKTIDSSDLFSINNGFMTINHAISPNYFIYLLKQDYANIFDDLNEIFESSYLSVLLKATVMTDYSTQLVYPIEINIQNTPKVINFVPKLNLISIENSNLTNSCIYKYNFASSTAISRFVRLNENMAHSEAEFKFSECSAKFYISNNGCLSIRSNKNNEACVQQNGIILKSGVYDLNFKLCFYDQNKVSCSDFYNQTLQVPYDIKNNSQIVLNQDYEFTSRLESSKNTIDFLKRSNLSVYFIILIGVIVLVGLITLLFLIIIFSKPKSGVKSSSEKALVLKKDLNFNKLEIITDIRSQTSASTPESTTATNSTKVSKTDDENEIKIQVLDDYVAKQFKQFGYENNNFSYSGSFRSSASSSEGEATRNIRVENDQGLYSVKNASIRFQNESDFVSPKPKDYDFYTNVQDLKPESLTSDLTTYNCLLVNTTLSNNSSAQLNPSDSYQHKNSTLQKIKNDLNAKKAIYCSVVDGKMYNNLNSTGSSTSNSLDNSNNKLVYDTGSFSFLNGNNDMLFSPNDVFASIV